MRKKVNIGGSANGRPSLSESENFGSSPSPPANLSLVRAHESRRRKPKT